MAKFAALPIFTDALLADTGHLTHDEFGRYMRLLIITWRTPECVIPNDPEWLSKRLQLSPLEYGEKIKPLILEFFTPCEDDAKLMQKRLRKEYDYVISKSEAGRVAAEKRWEKEKAIENKRKTPMRNGCETDAPTPTPTPTPTNNKIPPTPKGGAIEVVPDGRARGQVADFPDWMASDPSMMEAFAAFLQNRKDMKKPVKSAYAIARHIGTLTRLRDAGHDPVECINKAIERGWQAFYPPDGVGKTSFGSNAPQRPSHARKMQEAAVGAVMDYNQRKRGGDDDLID